MAARAGPAHKVTRLLLDEMLSPVIAEQLRDRDHDAVAVAERPELRSMPDDEFLAHATGEWRVLVTMNIGDFARIDATWKSQRRAHAGLMLVPSAGFPQNRSFIGRLVRALDQAIADGSAPSSDDVMFVAPPPDTRSRPRRNR